MLILIGPWQAAEWIENMMINSCRIFFSFRKPPENFEQYSIVFIGYPIWWGDAAWPVYNFVKNNDFTGKTVIPFATSSSSTLGQSGEHLKEMAGTGNWLEGHRFSSGATQSTIETWVNSLNLNA